MADHRDLDVCDPEELYERWVRFRTFYTRCNLTEGDDVPPAIYGIAQDVTEAMQDEMVVGLWKGRLIQELCWYTASEATHRPAPSQQAPSWSWTSSTRGVHDNVDPLSGARNMATVKELLAEKSQSRDMGPMNLVLRGRLIPASFQPTHVNHEYPTSKVWGTTDELAHCGIEISHDKKALPGDGTAVVDCHLLVLRYKHLSPEANNCWLAEGLSVVLHKPSNSYRRIGYWISCSHRAGILPIYESVQEQTIKLT
jgi:hypothetical protein